VNDIDPLAQFTVELDEPSTLVTVNCDECGAEICSVNDRDSLAGLANAADAHWRNNHARS
jgi:hypothetical protein